MVELKEMDESNKFSHLKNKLESISASMESDIKIMEEHKKRLMKY